MLGFTVDSWRRAGLEALAIAVGVSLGLAADTWDEQRRERELEQEFLQGIRLDVQATREDYARIRDSASENRQALERMIAAIEGGPRPWASRQAFAVDLVRCTFLGLPQPSRITFTELQSTGSMRVIRDVDFKRALAAWYREFDGKAQFFDEYRRKEAAMEEAMLGLLPLSVRLDLRPGASAPLDDDFTIDATLEVLAARPDVVARMEDMIWIHSRLDWQFAFLDEDGQALIARIDAQR